MTEHDDPSSADPSHQSTDSIERLLRIAGSRPAGDGDRARRVHAAVHEAWHDSLREHARRRWLTLGTIGLAAAAIVLVAVSLPRRTAPAPTEPPAATAARITAATGTVTRIGAARTVASNGDEAMVGSAFETGSGALATFAFAEGGELRLNEGTAVRFTGPRQVHVDRGAIYIDSGAQSGSLIVATPVGVVRDVGTRFEVAQRDSTWRVRVRDGLVQYDGATRHQATAGYELIVEPSGTAVERTASTYGADWDWVTRAAPAFRIEGQTLGVFLDWVAREGGRPVEFSNADQRRTLSSTILHGSIEGLTPGEALDVILPTCGLSYHIESQRVLVTSQMSAGGLR